MFVTVYTKTVKRRKGPDAGRTVTIGCAYQTKSLTAMHENIRKQCPDAVTYEDPKKVYTDFVPGLNLGGLPVVIGGSVVGVGSSYAGAAQ